MDLQYLNVFPVIQLIIENTILLQVCVIVLMDIMEMEQLFVLIVIIPVNFALVHPKQNVVHVLIQTQLSEYKIQLLYNVFVWMATIIKWIIKYVRFVISLVEHALTMVLTNV